MNNLKGWMGNRRMDTRIRNLCGATKEVDESDRITKRVYREGKCMGVRLVGPPRRKRWTNSVN